MSRGKSVKIVELVEVEPIVVLDETPIFIDQREVVINDLSKLFKVEAVKELPLELLKTLAREHLGKVYE